MPALIARPWKENDQISCRLRMFHQGSGKKTRAGGVEHCTRAKYAGSRHHQFHPAGRLFASEHNSRSRRTGRDGLRPPKPVANLPIHLRYRGGTDFKSILEGKTQPCSSKGERLLKETRRGRNRNRQTKHSEVAEEIDAGLSVESGQRPTGVVETRGDKAIISSSSKILPIRMEQLEACRRCVRQR
jgi:hypothetical protein